MPRKKQVNSKALIKAVKSQRLSTEIMAEFGIKTSAQLKALYLDAIVAEGLAPGLTITRGKKAAQANKKQIQINKRGSLIVPKEMIEEFGFKEGEVFSIRRTKAGLSIKKV